MAAGPGAARPTGAKPLSERALISCALGAGAALTAVLLLFGLVAAEVGDGPTPHASPAAQQLPAYSPSFSSGEFFEVSRMVP
jgi:hypothetical protein